MKQVLFTFSLFLISCVAFAQAPVQKKDVPKEVVNAYLSQHSRGASDSIWTKETVTIYKVYFMDEGKRKESHYFGDGRWIKTFSEMPVADLMPTITRRVGELYPGYAIVKSYVELNNDGKFYAVDLKKDKDEMTIYFYTDGRFAK